MKPILLATIAIIGISACGGDLVGECADTVKAEAVSPGGRYAATVFERNCGATTDYSTHVGIRDAEEPFDAAQQTRVLTIRGQANIALDWSSKNRLSVALPEAETFTKLETWRDIQIVYRDSRNSASP